MANSNTLSVSVKWSGKKYDVKLSLAESPAVFKSQLFSLTGVEPDRQKILVKGGTLKVPVVSFHDDANLNLGRYGLEDVEPQGRSRVHDDGNTERRRPEGAGGEGSIH